MRFEWWFKYFAFIFSEHLRSKLWHKSISTHLISTMSLGVQWSHNYLFICLLVVRVQIFIFLHFFGKLNFKNKLRIPFFWLVFFLCFYCSSFCAWVVLSENLHRISSLSHWIFPFSCRNVIEVTVVFIVAIWSVKS